MPTNLKCSNEVDPIVKAVLDHVVEVTQFYPSCIFPESLVRADLSMSEEQIHILTEGLAQTLGLDRPISFAHVDDFSLRDLVAKLREIASREELENAA